MKKIAVLVSGSGSNLQAIIDAVDNSFIPDVVIDCVISNREDAYGLERARKAGIDAIFFDPQNKSRDEYTKIITDELVNRKIDLVCLAGFMLILSSNIVEKFPKRILNIHPALIPKFCGKGMYGHYVHEAVIAAGAKESGATVHFVDEGCDTGEIILQEKVDVEVLDTPESLAKKVLKIEHTIYPKAIKMVLEKNEN